MQNTNADVVAFIDDDVQISDTWIDTVYKSFKENETLVFLGGTNLPNFTSDIPEWYYEFVDKKMTTGNVIIYHSWNLKGRQPYKSKIFGV